MADRGGPFEPGSSEALEIHRAQLRRLLEKDMEAWAGAFAEDAVFELPFAPADYPQCLNGRAAIYEYVKDYPNHIDLRDFPEVVEHETLDPAVVVVEAQADGRVVATGKPYRMRYVWIITTGNGEIVRQRDYWNPLVGLEALGGEQGLRDAFDTERG
ncbi:MAG: hypothetical protein BGO11_11625 [Solirubrobacterales bacterium 70-9]|nr:MAG: hypothetical protein BGO11_11625 [Solirubrobacterales bacterium 70-9]